MGAWAKACLGITSADRGQQRPLSSYLTVTIPLVCVLLVVLIAGGCSKRETLHPALRISDQDMSRAVNRGKGVISAGGDPADVFTYRLMAVNSRISSDVTLRDAGCCWPQDEICYQVAVGGDKSDAGVRRAANQALKVVERELRCVATVQIPKDRDPVSIDFALRTNLGVEYPPIAVETPKWVRDIAPAYDTSKPAAVLYYYVVRFPIRGGPGVPPVGPNVRSLSLVVKDGEAEATATFELPKPRTY